MHFAFPDGQKLVGKFLPSETIGDCLTHLQSCLVESLDINLYVTPPRRLLPTKATLQDEGLVPAAKIFVSFVNGSTPPSGKPYIRPELFGSKTSIDAASPVFPAGQSVHAAAKPAPSKPVSDAKQVGAKKPKRNKEEDLLRRMMGKK